MDKNRVRLIVFVAVGVGIALAATYALRHLVPRGDGGEKTSSPILGPTESVDNTGAVYPDRRRDLVEAVRKARPDLAGRSVSFAELAKPPWDEWKGRVSAEFAQQEDVPGGAALALMRPCWIHTREPNVACAEMYEALGDESGGFRGYVEVAANRVSVRLVGERSLEPEDWEAMSAILWLAYYAGDPRAFTTAYVTFTDAFVEAQTASTREAVMLMDAYMEEAHSIESAARGKYPALPLVAQSMCASLPLRAALHGGGYPALGVEYVLDAYPAGDARRRCLCEIAQLPGGRMLCSSRRLAGFTELCCAEGSP